MQLLSRHDRALSSEGNDGVVSEHIAAQVNKNSVQHRISSVGGRLDERVMNIMQKSDDGREY